MAKSFSGLGATICDVAADLPSSPVEGLIVFQKDTNELKIYDGSVWCSVLDTDAPPAMVLINPTSVTGGTVSNGVVSFSNTAQVFVNGVFSNQFRNYRVLFNATNTSATIGNIRWRWRAAGVDYDNNYYNRMWYQHAGSFQTASNDAVQYSEWIYISNIQAYASFDVFDPYILAPSGYTVHHQAWGGTNNLVGETHSWHYQNRQNDGFSMNPTGGNMTGTLRVYGIRDSI